MSALEAEGLSHSFGRRRALDAVTFVVEEGRFTVLLGPNGAGKTTLFSLATGLYHSRSGRVRIHGRDIHADPARALAEIGVVFQQPTLDLDLTVDENLAYHAGLHGLGSDVARARAAEELDRLGILDRRTELARTLSGGQRRRVEIARAMIHRPHLLLLDEPTTGLDVAGRRSLLEHVRELCSTRGIAVLWATHLLEEVQGSDLLVVLHQGRVRWQGIAAAIGPELRVDGLPAAFSKLTEEP